MAEMAKLRRVTEAIYAGAVSVAMHLGKKSLDDKAGKPSNDASKDKPTFNKEVRKTKLKPIPCRVRSGAFHQRELARSAARGRNNMAAIASGPNY